MVTGNFAVGRMRVMNRIPKDQVRNWISHSPPSRISHGGQSTSTLSASIAVYRPQRKILPVDVTVNSAYPEKNSRNFRCL